MSETDLTAQIRLALSQHGATLFRNNIGVARDKRTDRVIRYGLANESAAMNQVLKSGDMIGWTHDGRFLSIEVKAPGWEYTGTGHEYAQLCWIKAVKLAGGRAGFAASVEDAVRIYSGTQRNGLHRKMQPARPPTLTKNTTGTQTRHARYSFNDPRYCRQSCHAELQAVHLLVSGR